MQKHICIVTGWWLLFGGKITDSPVAQWVEHSKLNWEVLGSFLGWGIRFFLWAAPDCQRHLFSQKDTWCKVCLDRPPVCIPNHFWKTKFQVTHMKNELCLWNKKHFYSLKLNKLLKTIYFMFIFNIFSKLSLFNWTKSKVVRFRNVPKPNHLNPKPNHLHLMCKNILKIFYNAKNYYLVLKSNSSSFQNCFHYFSNLKIKVFRSICFTWVQNTVWSIKSYGKTSENSCILKK